MAQCIISANLGGTCDFILGGLARILLMNKTDITSISASAVTFTSSAKTAYEISFAPDTAGFTSELQVSNGQKYVNQTLVFNVASKSQATLDQTTGLALGNYVALAQDRAGVWYVIARVGYGLQATVLTINSGVQAGDAALLVVNMSNPCTEYPVIYTGTLPAIAA